MKGELQLEPPGDRNPSDSDPLLAADDSSQSAIPTEIIKDEDLEAGSVSCCRICLECDGEEDDELISPCMCKGTQQFVHRSCLDHWRSVKEGFAFSHCTTCKAQFHLRVVELEDNSWRRIKFRLFVARDVFLVFVAVQTLGGTEEVPSVDSHTHSSYESYIFDIGLTNLAARSLLLHYHISQARGPWFIYDLEGQGVPLGWIPSLLALLTMGLALVQSGVPLSSLPGPTCGNLILIFPRFTTNLRKEKGTSFEMNFQDPVCFWDRSARDMVIALMGGFAYLMDKDGTFRNSFNDSWDRILSRHPIPFYYCIGVLAFFVLLGFFGLILHCSSLNSNDPRMAGCHNCCYGWGILDCFPASMEACFALVIVFVVIFAILGIAYGFLAATMAIQRIWQRHYHILTKRELTQEYIVEDLHGCYTPPKLDAEHEERLKMLKLL
ncbi:hypothetical protein LguiA_019882 [Lonicera macranthoides]